MARTMTAMVAGSGALLAAFGSGRQDRRDESIFCSPGFLRAMWCGLRLDAIVLGQRLEVGREILVEVHKEVAFGILNHELRAERKRVR